MIKYAGIGSRQTPKDVCEKMSLIAFNLAMRYNMRLRSGNARGADRAFVQGCIAAMGKGEIFEATNVSANPHWMEHARQFHPAWKKCDGTAKLLHARNSAIMLGRELNDPVKFVVCWTVDGKSTGGTGQALRIAAVLGIPVFNLHDATACSALLAWLRDNGNVV